MADENQELRRVSWTEMFSFTHIFKTWKMAKHHNKLLLAFVAIVLIYLIGCVMDYVWSKADGTAQVSDVYAYFQAPNKAVYADTLDKRDEANRAQLVDWYIEAKAAEWDFTTFMAVYRAEGGRRDSAFGKQLLAEIKASQGDNQPPTAPDRGKIANDAKRDWSDVWRRYDLAVSDMLGDAASMIDKAADKADEQIEEEADEDIPELEQQAERDYYAARRALWKAQAKLVGQRSEQLHGRGLFAVLTKYERHCITSAFGAVRRGNIFSGVGKVLRDRQRLVVSRGGAGPAISYTAASGGTEAVGLIGWVVLMLQGPVWLFATHWLYAIVFTVLTMAVWAVFGGAIARIAALHAAREEAISMGQAVRFSMGKFISFFTAPLILVIIILALGLILGLGGLIMALPVGDIIMSILFLLALALGAAIAFVGIGLIAGGPLMYPTIAVEGSDSFDAISRSFSYVFWRPWRYGLYTLVAAVYGTACYLFVRVFAYGTLIATHAFVARGFFGGGMNSNAAPELAEGAGKMDLLWGRPTFDNLAGTWNGGAMSGMDAIPAAIIRIWVYVVVGLVAAFVISFTVSAFTNIYYLLRRKVDATDLDDVYIDEPEEPFVDADLGEPVEEVPAPAAEPVAEPEPEAEDEEAEKPDQ